MCNNAPGFRQSLKAKAAKAKAWKDGKLKALKAGAHATGKSIRNGVQPSFVGIARLLLRLVLALLICLFAPFLVVFALCHDWIMKKFINYAYIYNVSWEDPRMDQKVFNLREDDHIITIASAGCNVLDYIIEGARVTAVDFNACQIALTELKAVAIKELTFEQVFAIFGKNNVQLLRELYPTHLRPHLSPLATDFWDGYVKRITSFMYSGTSGFLAFLAFRVVFPMLHLGWIRQAIQERMSREEFIALCHEHDQQLNICSWLMDTLLPCFALFAGVPKRQMNLGLGRENFSVIIHHVLFNTDLVHDNYFYAGYILGEYTEENCPRYLKRENFARMKKHLKAGKLGLFHGSIEQAIMKNRDDNDALFTVASLLDHMDWMDKSMVTSEISLLMERMDHVRGRVYWRSFSENVHIPPLVWLNATKVDDIYQNTMEDRVGMYFSTWIAHLRDSDFEVTARCNSWNNSGYTSGLKEKIMTGAKIVTAPVWKKVVQTKNANGSKHEKDMEAFYRFQKEGYDNFRENFLHARADMMHSIPTKKGGKMVWIDVGGGTARNLEFLPVDVIKKYFKTIFVVDVSPSLLEIAQRRVAAMGLEGIVQIVEQDFTAASVFKRMSGLEGRVDLITFSYSLSMIPDKVSAINNALKFLKPNGQGVLGLADFFLSGGEEEETLPFFFHLMRKIEATFQRKWFEQDRVNLLSPVLLSRIARSTNLVWDERFRGGVPLLPVLRPYHGAYVAVTAKDMKLQ